MSKPLVTIGVPVYNGERYLAATLDSLINQDVDDLEIVVSDNASADGTEEIARSYASRDRRIRYYRNASNIGSAPNYRRVFELARGTFFKWSSHDDVCRPGFVRRCLEVFEASGSRVVLVYPRCNLIDECGTVLRRAPDCVETVAARPHRRLATVLRNVSYAYPVWGLIRSDCLRQTRLTGTTYYWDRVLLAELALHGGIREIQEVLSAQRVHDGNAVARAMWPNREPSAPPSEKSRRVRQRMREWTDPAHGGRRVWLPYHEERYWEYLKRVHQTPLSATDKLWCYATVPLVCYEVRCRNVAGMWKRRILRQELGPCADE